MAERELSIREKSDIAAARFLEAYWRMPGRERELFLQVLVDRGTKWSDEWDGPKPGVHEAINLVERPAPDDPRRNLRPQLRVVRR